MTLRQLRPAIALCVVTLLLAVAAARAQTSGKIEGKVVDGDGKALAGVKVEASESATGVRTTTTDKSGRYRFLAVQPGDYKVAFTLDDHADVQKYGSVRLGATLTIDVKMFRVSG